MKTSWLSIHLFYEDLNLILINGVFPFIDKMRQEKKINQYFFIRYSEGGSHVRLRLKTNEKQTVKADCQAYFSLFFKQNASQRSFHLPHYYPNNSLQFIDYEPELERYGGSEKIGIAEEYFQFSSEIIQSLMCQNDSFEYEAAMGWAIQLHVIFAKAVNLSKKDSLLFFEQYYKNWSKLLPKTNLAIDKEIEGNRGVITFIQNLWENIDDTIVFEDDIFQKWYDGNKKLIASKDYFNYYNSYIHMTNNRLGLYNQDETWIAKLIYYALVTTEKT